MALARIEPVPFPRIPPVPKPKGWDALPIHKQIRHYGDRLGPTHARFADKLLAKDYVERLGVPGVRVAPVVRILDGPDDLRPEDLAPDCIVKATHGCKWNIFGGEKSLDDARRLLHDWNRPYVGHAPCKQTQYAHIPPRFFVERESMMGDKSEER
jgi:hypothetical protein